MVWNKRTKQGIALLGVLVLLAVAYWAYGYFKQQKINSHYSVPPAPVEVTTVKRDQIPQVLQAMGDLKANQQVDLSPELDGHIKRILFSNGQYVKKGQALVEMNDATAKAELASSTAALSLNKLKYQRLKTLAKRSAVSRQDLDQAESDLRQAQSQVDADRAALKFTILRAPFSGYIGARQADVGQFVKAGTTIATLVDIHQIKADYSVPANYAPKLALGQKVFASVAAYPNKKFVGVVTYVAPYADATTRSIALEATIPNNSQMLTPGVFAQVEQTLGSNANALVVPMSALVPTIEGVTVYKVVNKLARSVTIKVGTYWDKQVEVLSGLNAGDVIVMAGQQRLRDGREVKIVPNTWQKAN